MTQTLQVDPIQIFYPNGGTSSVQVYIWDGSKPVLWDGSVTFSGSLPSTVQGNKTNNGAVPGTNNLGALVAVANAAAPTYTEGREVLLSTDLTGSLRVSATIDTSAIATSANQTNGSQKTQIVDGSGNVIGSTGNALQVNLKTSSITLPVSLTSTTITGNVTVVQPTGTNLHAVIDTGSTTAVTQATAANLNATVVGTGTFAVQATIAAGSAVIGHVITDSGSVTSAVLTTGSAQIGHLEANQSVNVAQLAGTTTDTNSGNKSAGTLRVVLATDQPQLTNKLLVTPDANSAINLAQVGGTTVVNGGVAGSQSIGGTVATNVAITANPVNLGAQGVSSENSAVTTARQVQLVADLVGKLIVLPYANPENFVSGAITSAMTGTTSTSLIASPGGSLRNYITQITVSNSHATVGTDIIIQDGSGGTTLYTIPAAAVYGGATVTFPVPLRQPTTATAIFCANVTTGASTKVSASGYKGL